MEHLKERKLLKSKYGVIPIVTANICNNILSDLKR